MKPLKLFLLMFSFFGLFSGKAQEAQSIHSFKVKSLDGKIIDFSKFKGKKILVVNTASECGFTPQYEDLEKLYKTYKDKLVIVGFPANNFLWNFTKILLNEKGEVIDSFISTTKPMSDSITKYLK